MIYPDSVARRATRQGDGAGAARASGQTVEVDMRLSQLLSAAEVECRHCGADTEVTEVCDDSRRCRPQACFVAVRGPDVDGHAHIGSAVSAGAVAVVCEDTSSVPAGVPCAVVNDTREALGRLAQAAVGWPVRRLVNVAVTGTNGKTTVTRLIREILSAAGRPCGSVGTIGYDTGRQSLPAVTTTPGAVELAALAADMVAAGRTHLVMETSSHALDQRRTAGINFQVAVLTNVSGDHID